MTIWDLRSAARALGATLVALAVVWLVTAASDEGQLTAGVRASRTLPLAPLCSAVGAALALGTSRVRSEVRALEALGRSPAESARWAAGGAALPSVVMGIAIAVASTVDVGGFYPRAPRGEAFVRDETAFVSVALGVRVADDGDVRAIAAGEAAPADEGLPGGARAAAGATTALAGVALALVASRAALRTSPSDRRSRRRMRVRAGAAILGCALATLVAFQAAAARAAPTAIAVAPSVVVLVFELLVRRSRYGSAHGSVA